MVKFVDCPTVEKPHSTSKKERDQFTLNEHEILFERELKCIQQQYEILCSLQQANLTPNTEINTLVAVLYLKILYGQLELDLVDLIESFSEKDKRKEKASIERRIVTFSHQLSAMQDTLSEQLKKWSIWYRKNSAFYADSPSITKINGLFIALDKWLQIIGYADSFYTVDKNKDDYNSISSSIEKLVNELQLEKVLCFNNRMYTMIQANMHQIFFRSSYVLPQIQAIQKLHNHFVTIEEQFEQEEGLAFDCFSDMSYDDTDSECDESRHIPIAFRSFSRS